MRGFLSSRARDEAFTDYGDFDYYSAYLAALKARRLASFEQLQCIQDDYKKALGIINDIDD